MRDETNLEMQISQTLLHQPLIRSIHHAEGNIIMFEKIEAQL